MKQSVEDYLNQQYNDALDVVGSGNTVQSSLLKDEKEALDEVVRYAESAKAVLTVIITSLVYKHFNPGQDIRKHQSGIPQGYSGRTFDAQHITPFLKKVKFPAMAESGWLTRSLEQKVPYDENYTGAINPVSLKAAFIKTLGFIENDGDYDKYLSYILQGLVIQRNKQVIELAKPATLPIHKIMHLLNEHFFSKYKSEGAARLPVLAIYAIYQVVLAENQRYFGKKLLPIESHTSSDLRSGRIGDVEISDANGKSFEAVEVKHGIALSAQLVADAFAKFSKTQVSRYYLLSSNDKVSDDEALKIKAEIERIRNIHGCEVITNGLIPTLKYYLRLIADPAQFIDVYVNLIESDKALKFEHKQQWNEIVSKMAG